MMASTNTLNIPTQLNLKENHNIQFITICAVFTFLSLAAIIARLASKRIKRVQFGLDDVLLSFAWVIGGGLSVMFACGTKYARFGWHVSALNKHQLTALLKSYYATSFLQSTSLVLAKLSVLILLRRIFITSAFQITILILGTIVVLGWIAVVFGGAFICFPVESLWEPELTATCGNREIMNKISPIFWVLTDFVILVCPLPVIKNLQIDSGQRVGLYAIFLIGGLTCIVSVIRYRTLFYPRHDISWDEVPTVTWSVVEVHVTIICAALIACKPVVTLLFSSVRASWSHLRSQLPRKLSGSSSHLELNHSQPQSPLPLLGLTRTSEASSITRDLQNATSMHEIRVERTFDIRDGEFV